MSVTAVLDDGLKALFRLAGHEASHIDDLVRLTRSTEGLTEAMQRGTLSRWLGRNSERLPPEFAGALRRISQDEFLTSTLRNLDNTDINWARHFENAGRSNPELASLLTRHQQSVIELKRAEQTHEAVAALRDRTKMADAFEARRMPWDFIAARTSRAAREGWGPELQLRRERYGHFGEFVKPLPRPVGQSIDLREVNTYVRAARHSMAELWRFRKPAFLLGTAGAITLYIRNPEEGDKVVNAAGRFARSAGETTVDIARDIAPEVVDEVVTAVKENASELTRLTFDFVEAPAGWTREFMEGAGVDEQTAGLLSEFLHKNPVLLALELTSGLKGRELAEQLAASVENAQHHPGGVDGYIKEYYDVDNNQILAEVHKMQADARTLLANRVTAGTHLGSGATPGSGQSLSQIANGAFRNASGPELDTMLTAAQTAVNGATQHTSNFGWFDFALFALGMKSFNGMGLKDKFNAYADLAKFMKDNTATLAFLAELPLVGSWIKSKIPDVTGVQRLALDSIDEAVPNLMSPNRNGAQASAADGPDSYRIEDYRPRPAPGINFDAA